MTNDAQPTMNDKQRTADNEPRTILKFDTGADGFLQMIWVLIIFSILILGLGIYFLLTTFGQRSL